MMDTRESKCLLCSLGCDVAFRMKGSAVAGPEFVARGDAHSARVCARGLYGTELLTHHQRVAEPFVRRDGVLREASWQDAIDVAAAELRAVIDTHGVSSVAVVTEPTRSTAEIEAVGAFARAIGAGAVCCALEPQDWPLVAGQPCAGVDAIVEANCVVVIGDVFFSHAVVAREIIDAKYTARGNALFVIDPRRSNTAWYASTHVQNRPGTEALILAAALKSLKSSGKLAADSHVWLDSLDEKALLEAAGVGRDVVARMAHAFADAAKAAIVVAPSARGVSDVALVARLAALLAQVTGGQKGFVSLPSGGNVLGAQQVVAKGGWTPASQLVADLAAGQYRALINFGGDLTASYPSAALSKALASLDAVVSYSLFRGETERVSSVILGAASWFESDGSAVRFDGSVVDWMAVGAPSWGTRTLKDVVSQLEGAVGSVAAATSGAAAGATDVWDDALAARVEAAREAAMGRASRGMSLVALPATGHMGAGAITRWMDWAREMFPVGFTEISQEDAAAAGIKEKDCVVLSSPFAQVELSARLTDRLQAGVVAVPGYDPAARALFSWQPGTDGWFDTGPGGVRLSRKQS